MEELFFQGQMLLPPSVNMAYRVIFLNDCYRIGPSATLVQFKHDALLTLSQAKCNWTLVQEIQRAKQHIPLAATLQIFFPTMWKSDLDGREKYAVDAAFSYLNLNDNQIVKMSLEKLVDRVNPRVELSLAIIR